MSETRSAVAVRVGRAGDPVLDEGTASMRVKKTWGIDNKGVDPGLGWTNRGPHFSVTHAQ